MSESQNKRTRLDITEHQNTIELAPNFQYAPNSQQAPKYLLTQLRSIPNAQSYQQQLIIIQEIQSIIQEARNLNTDILNDMNILLTEDICKELKQQIGNGEQDVQKALLQIVLDISEWRSEFQVIYADRDYFEHFGNSELILKVYQILNRELKKKNKQQFHSKFIIELSQTIAFSQIQYETQNFDDYPQLEILITQIKRFIMKLTKYEKNQQINIKVQQINIDECENELLIALRTMNALVVLAKDGEGCGQLSGYYKILQIVSPLIHINCSCLLHSNLNFQLYNLEIIQRFQESVFKFLGEFICNKGDLKYLLYNHSIINHITQIIIQFASSFSNKTDTISTFQQSIDQSSSSYNYKQSQSNTYGALYLLRQIYYYPSLCQQSILIPNLFTSLIALSKYKRKVHENRKNDIQSGNIREYSYYLLYQIWKISSDKIRTLMYKHSQFINSLIEGLRCAGGNEEEYKSAIEQSIAVVREIYFKIINRVGIYSEFFELRKDFESQIEEFGDGEELESHLFHFIVLHESGVKEYAEDACSTITLAFKHPTNGNNLHDFDKIEKEELTYDEIDFEI